MMDADAYGLHTRVRFCEMSSGSAREEEPGARRGHPMHPESNGVV